MQFKVVSLLTLLYLGLFGLKVNAQEAPIGAAQFFPSENVSGKNASQDTNSVEIGVKFSVKQVGTITKIKFYRGVTNPNGYKVFLRKLNHNDNQQTIVATAEGGANQTGWVQISIEPVNVNPGEVYIASYFTTNGQYTYSNNYWNGSDIPQNGRVTPLRDKELGPNGVFSYSPEYLTEGFVSSNYWVDVVYAPSPQSTYQFYGNFGINGYPFINPHFQPKATYNDRQPLELGLRFESFKAATVKAFAFYYVGTGQQKTISCSLWSSDKFKLATSTVSLTNVNYKGWVYLTGLSGNPAIEAFKDYTVSCNFPDGVYAAVKDYFNSGLASGPLSAPPDAGVYTYGPSAFPSSTYRSSNYFIDLVVETND